MNHAESLKRKISYTLLCLLFGFSIGIIFLSEVINLKNGQQASKNIAGIERGSATVSDSQTNEDCVITNDKASEDSNENDTLFIGCNGFF